MLTLVLAAATGGQTSTPVGAAAADDWKMFHRDERHTGVSPDSSLGARSAPSLRLQWQANTGAPTFTGPAAVFNPALGKTLVYQGTQSGSLIAYDAATGERTWTFSGASRISSSPAVVSGVVYIGDDRRLHALNATTGAVICSFDAGGIINASPVVVNPDGAGRIVYFADNGTTGSDDGGHIWAVNGVDPNPARDCSLKWAFDAFGNPPGSRPEAGAWSPPGYAKDAAGRPLVVIGSSSPDNAVYAFDARTGAVAWRFQTEFRFLDADVGTGPTIRPPGRGAADGAVYVTSKSKITYALNLRTGRKLWEFRIRDDSPGAGGSTRSTAALLQDRLYLGYGSGVYALNATTGAKVWKTELDDRVEVVSSPALSGAPGDRVLFVGDLAGKVYALRTGDGVKRWSYTTGAYIYGSPALSGGKVFIGSADGFLYAFGLTSLVGHPVAAIDVPAQDAVVENTGEAALSGTVSDDTLVRQALIAVRRDDGLWWDGSTETWTTGFTENPATLDAPDTAATAWTYRFPVGPNGETLFAQAVALDDQGRRSVPVAKVDFRVDSTGNPPETTITAPVQNQVFGFPATGRASFAITLRGTATDTDGANPGVRQVRVTVRNSEHGEYFCGSPTCAGGTGHFAAFVTEPRTVDASLSSPGGQSSDWTLTFPAYDHPHRYVVSATAVDSDGEPDPTRAEVDAFCVRDPGFSCRQAGP